MTAVVEATSSVLKTTAVLRPVTDGMSTTTPMSAASQTMRVR